MQARAHAPLYDVEEYGTPQWRAQHFVFDVKAYYERSIENGLDQAHNEYVQLPAPGESKKKMLPGGTATERVATPSENPLTDTMESDDEIPAPVTPRFSI